MKLTSADGMTAQQAVDFPSSKPGFARIHQKRGNSAPTTRRYGLCVDNEYVGYGGIAYPGLGAIQQPARTVFLSQR